MPDEAALPGDEPGALPDAERPVTDDEDAVVGLTSPGQARSRRGPAQAVEGGPQAATPAPG